MTTTLTEQLAEQLDWHWRNQLRTRLAGLTDTEYHWEPVTGAWGVRPREQAATPIGAGAFSLDFTFPQPDPPPLTTIAWRLAHVTVGVFGMRVANHFGGPDISYRDHAYAETAAAALEQLDAGYAAWSRGVRSLDDAQLWRPCGPAEGPFAEYPMIALVLHINREVLHHGAEIALLRDLFLWSDGGFERSSHPRQNRR